MIVIGTRADFWIGRGEQAEWLGSVAWDGYPSGIAQQKVTIVKTGEETTVLESTTEREFRQRLKLMFALRDDATRPEQGWPWPWATSATTDYAYTFDDGRVWVSNFGSPWCSREELEALEAKGGALEGPAPVFRDMTAVQKVDLGKRSGLIVLGLQPSKKKRRSRK